jgi:ketosteroid isomerase-like protein
MLKTLFIAALALVAADGVSAAPRTPAAQIEAAERAFAADGATMGVKGAFLKHMADDAIVFDPAPVNARALYEARSNKDELKLQWWPAWVVAARSGDLGLSTGPWAIDGRRGGWFATIWRRDADGVWRWIYDGGAQADVLSAPGPETPAAFGPVAKTGEASPAGAFDAVRALETTLSREARQDTAKAYKAFLSADARLLGPRGTRTLASTALDPRLAQRPTPMSLILRGGGASRAGDLVWTHGEAKWPGNDEGAGQKSVAGHYMHVWQRRPEGWRLIFETLINDR